MLENRVAIVTGATGALGRVVTKRLLGDGVKVVVPYRTEARYDELLRYLGEPKENVLGVKADCTEEEEVRDLAQRAQERYGRIDMLFNLVGGYAGGKELEETEEEQWDYVMGLNLKSAFLCSKAVLPYMKEQNYGKIVSVSARPGAEKRWRAKSIPYSVSKAGVIALTEGIAEEVKNYEINCNCVIPSTMDTLDNRQRFPKADFSKWVPPENVAEVLMFLASDAARPTNGAAIPVYGKA